LKVRGGEDGFNPYFFDPDKKPELLPPELEKEEKKKTVAKNLDNELKEKNGFF